MSYKITKEPRTLEAWIELNNSFRVIYTEDTHRRIALSRDSLHSHLDVREVRNAYKSGKTCDGFSLYGKTGDAIIELLEAMDWSIDKLMARCAQALGESNHSTIREGDIKIDVSRTDEKSIRTFSPLPEALQSLKPLKAIPAKWKPADVIRMLANGQAEDLRTLRTLSDDYAYDAAHNFHENAAVEPLTLIERIVRNPKSWWMSGGKEEGDQMSICCHGFDEKICTVTLLREKKAAA
tara:strand:- start:3581 stop:4291 length:711 start_codon:yes stop_codon:yes gene_type:complete